MTDFDATGTLIIESIEGAQAELEDEFEVSASASASSGSRGRGSTRRTNDHLSTAVSTLEYNIDLDETRNDLLRELLDESQSDRFQRAKGRGSTLGLLGAGVGVIAGALSALPGLLSDALPGPGDTSPGAGPASGRPTPSPSPAPDPAGSGESSGLLDSARLAATDLIENPIQVLEEDVISDPATIRAADLIASAANIPAASLITSGARILASDVIESPVSLNIGDLLGDVPDITPDDIRKGLGIAAGGAAGAAAGAATGAGGGLSPSAPRIGGVGAPPIVAPQLVETLDDLTSGNIIPQAENTAGGRRQNPTRVENTVNVEQTPRSRQEKQNIIQEVTQQVRRDLEGAL